MKKKLAWLKNYLGNRFYPYTHADAVYVDDTLPKNLTTTLDEMNRKINTMQGGEIDNLHIHDNMEILDLITNETMDKIEASYDHISDESKHIPAGGENGQVIGKKDGTLKWIDQQTGSDGTNNPTKLSQLENDTGYITGDLLEGKVDKVEGKGLSENDYTNQEKAKLSNIPQIIFSTEIPTTLNENTICFVYEE